MAEKFQSLIGTIIVHGASDLHGDEKVSIPHRYDNSGGGIVTERNFTKFLFQSLIGTIIAVKGFLSGRLNLVSIPHRYDNSRNSWNSTPNPAKVSIPHRYDNRFDVFGSERSLGLFQSLIGTIIAYNKDKTKGTQGEFQSLIGTIIVSGLRSRPGTGCSFNPS